MSHFFASLSRLIPPPHLSPLARRVAFLASCLGLILWRPVPLVAEEPPRYLFFNIAPASAWNQN